MVWPTPDIESAHQKVTASSSFLSAVPESIAGLKK
jgi:hypothetical protein